MLKKKFVLVAIAALVTLIGTGLISDRSTRVIAEAVAFAEHTREVLLSIDRLRASIAEAESNTRGYVITAARDFTLDFERSKATVDHELRRLEELTAGDAHQSQSLFFVRQLVGRRVELLHRLSDLRASGASPADIESTVLSGLLVNRSISSALDEIRSDELLRLEAQRRNAESAFRFAIWSTWIMCVVAVVMFVALIFQVVITLRREYEARRELERAVSHEMTARQRAQDADQLKDEFLATLSHELRTPLTAISGWASLLADPKARSSLLDEGLANITQAARTQSQLIEDLLDVSRIITGKMKLSIVEVNLVEVIEQAIGTVAPSARAKDIELRTFLDASAATVNGDAGRLQQVFWNLLSNAIKFTPKSGRIDVALRRVSSHVEISVKDNGDGIPADLLPHVFERFRQGDGAARHAGGLGLGLSIVKHFVELHGGEVRAESGGPGSGATFIVELPVAAVKKTSDPMRRAPEPDLVGSEIGPHGVRSDLLAGRHIVIVDNDARTLELLSAVLSSAGADVLTAMNTADAGALISASRADALICDIGLPDEDGLAFIRRLRSMLTSYAQLPAIALTARGRSEDRMRALAAGFNGYLVKPVLRDELLFAIASLLHAELDKREPVLAATSAVAGDC